MSTSRPPSRARLSLAALVGAVAILASACAAITDPAAATVNGERISDRRVQDELAAIRNNAAYLAALEGQTPVRGQSDGTFDAAFVARVVSLQIYYRLIEQELERRDLEVTDADLDEVREPTISGSGGPEIFGEFPEWYQDELVRRQALFMVLNDSLAEGVVGEGAARRYYEERSDALEQVCTSHILVETEVEAEAVLDRLQAGEDFAAVAEDESLDPGSAAQGGELGCFDRDAPLVPEFLAAAFELDGGELSDPVETQFGWHVILVTERRMPTFEEVEAELEQRLRRDAEEAFGRWLSEATSKGDIDVNPRYGSWVVTEELGTGSMGRVQPPEGPAPAPVPAPDSPGPGDL